MHIFLRSENLWKFWNPNLLISEYKILNTDVKYQKWYKSRILKITIEKWVKKKRNWIIYGWIWSEYFPPGDRLFHKLHT